MRLAYALLFNCSVAACVAVGCGSSGNGSNFTNGDGGAGDDASPTGEAGAGVCTPGATKCNGTALDTCRTDGSGYDTIPCVNSTCDNGACVCTPGATVCKGQTVQKCGTDHMMHDDHACPVNTTCREGLCDDQRCADETMTQGEIQLPVEGWPRYRHDNRNSGWTHSIVADMPTLKWKKFIGGTNLNGTNGGLAAGPIVSQNDIIFIGAGDLDGRMGLFYSLDATGNVLFTFNGPRSYGWSTPAVRKDGTSYYSAADGNAYAVKPDGTKLWSYVFGFQNDCSPIVTKDGYVIYGSDSGELFALKSDGTLLWKSDVATGPGEVDSGLAESCDGKVIYAGGRNGWLGIDPQTGVTKWKVMATGSFVSLVSSPVVTFDGTMYGVDSGGLIYAIDSNGMVKWKTTSGTAGAGTTPAHVANWLFAVMNDGNLHAYDATSGAPLWSKPVNNRAETYYHGGPVVDGKQRLYFNSNDGFVYAFDTSGNQLWKIAASGTAATSPASYGTMAIGRDGTLYVPGNDGYLYAFK